MGERPFPCVKYAAELQGETIERIEQVEEDNLTVSRFGNPEPESSLLMLKRVGEDDSEVLLVLLMNADHRYAESYENHENRPNYEFYNNDTMEATDKLDEYQRIDMARQR